MTDDETHLRVFKNRSELITEAGKTEIFLEGATSGAARERLRKIREQLTAGYFEDVIVECRDNPEALDFSALTEEHQNLMRTLVESVTSERGRALVALATIQMALKSLDPSQSIRLHKGGRGDGFGWQEGLPMRSLDNLYFTPALRKHQLLKLNADGAFMTRSLAENYPYSPVFKAQLRGAREEWLALVEAIEEENLHAAQGLRFMLVQLMNHAESFRALAEATLSSVETYLRNPRTISEVISLMKQHTTESNHAARIMEVSMHALMQALEESGSLNGAKVVPLSQMRSANKKHGNIGDIELSEAGGIVEAWDAKYGKAYLRDELEELVDKLPSHAALEVTGFVTSVSPERVGELEARIQEIEDIYGVRPQILLFDTWAQRQLGRAEEVGLSTENELAAAWLRAYTESLAQKRAEIAPIDEPCYDWLALLKTILDRV